MEFLLNSSQMKFCDSDTIHKIGIPSLVLMERAALCVVEEMQSAQCDLKSVLVVCGSGNNGGDGFAVARLLDELGVRVTAAFVGREESMSKETALQRKICENCGIKICSNYREREYTTIVDALFGIGLSRDVDGEYARVIEWMNAQAAMKVSVDIPSGISADTGRVMGTAVQADLTVTFAYRKIGQILYPGTEYCRKVVRRDIGITADRFQNGIPSVFTYNDEDLLRIRQRQAYSNKGTFGKILLIAGSEGMSGAAALAALSAYRSGSGLVKIYTPACNLQILQTFLPEAIVSAYEPGNVQKEELDRALLWADVVGIGPGIGTGGDSRKILDYVLENAEKPLVIDADGLNLLSGNVKKLRQTGAPVIVTPHIGEMTRLSGLSKAQILENILETARDFAQNNRVICALKDARTVVSDGSRVYINTTGNSGMAVAGSGDILTGIVCGLLAQGMQPFDAAALGVYLHGAAGDLAREECSAYGMIARDIAAQIGEVLKKADLEEAHETA